MGLDPVWWVFIVFLSVLINMGVMLYFLYAKLEGAEDLLHDVKFISWYKHTYGTSLLGRQARMNAISMVVMMPGLMIKRGEVSLEAYSRLPSSLVNRIRMLYLLMIANGLAMIALYVFAF